MNNSIHNYVEENKERFLEELFTLLRIPSVSSQEAHKADMQLCAEQWCNILLSSGLDSAKVYPTQGHPVIVAQKNINPNWPTVLVYGHYDVMPAEPLEKWTSNPFAPEIRDGHIWARGANDDKGQAMIQVKALETALQLGIVKCNVKVLLEGEEEIGSPSLEAFCLEHQDLLKADLILVSDTSMLGADTPSITVGLRGMAYWQVELTGPNKDLHSGHYGGAVANPIIELCNLIAGLFGPNNEILIPGFYDGVEPLSQKEKDMIVQIPFCEEDYKASIGVAELKGEHGYHTIERRSTRPCLDVCGIWGGYTGEGAKTVIPSKAYAKISARLVPNQNYQEVSQAMVNYLQEKCPPYVSINVTPMHGGAPYVFPIEHPAYTFAEKAYSKVFGVPPIALRSGGSIPIISTFEKVLGCKSLLMGFGLDSDAIHSPNENFSVDMFVKGIETIAQFYAQYNN